MENQTGQTIPITIEDELKTSYLNYAMSVIVSRALPDVRDGLKPVHRRILFGMNEMGLHSDRPPKKSARIVGDVLGKYHPHGDMSVYDALVRMAQNFSLRYPLIKGQGNFGSVDGDPPAAMRYTEARLAVIAGEMLKDINKETVDFQPNYDDSMTEPHVLPAVFPCLLANGTSGIAVGMATNIPPHNLGEISAAIHAFIENPDISIDQLMNHISGPDFPTGGIIFGTQGITDAYKTGRGKITVRSRFSMEEGKNGRTVIIIHELPYQVNKANLIMKIADRIRDKKIDGISDLRDESDRNGMRIIIELKRGIIPKVVLNNLFNHTQLQMNFNVNALALVNGRPQLLTLKDMIRYYVEHRRDVIIRRTQYDLRKAEERAHILEGLKIALADIDAVIAVIKKSSTVKEAKSRLTEQFTLSEIQAQAILDMRLQKLTSLETQKILEELKELTILIRHLKELLASDKDILALVGKENSELTERFNQPRRTELNRDEIKETHIEDLIQKENMLVVISHKGYIKRVPVTSYRVQGRGGKGVSASNLRDTDFIQNIFVATTHDYILIISSKAKAYYLKVHEIPEGSRNSRGSHIRSLLGISTEEEVAAVVPLQNFTNTQFILLATAQGIVKKVATSNFSNAKSRGIIAMIIQPNDKIVSAILTSGDRDIILATRSGLGLRFNENMIRPMGRATQGVIGIRISPDDELTGAIETDPELHLLFITENGSGKRLKSDALKTHGRNTKGQIIYHTTEKTGAIAGVLNVHESDDIMLITSSGALIKIKASSVTVQNRDTHGVRLFNIQKPDILVGIDRIVRDEDENDGGGENKKGSEISLNFD
ncbi:MAG: DNA topoisomerase (ATP-hydrolyzing) subunit A [Salinispira sp.]